MFDTIEKLGNWGETLSFASALIGTILFLTYFFGMIFTSSGREELSAKPFLTIFIIFMFIFGYFYWFDIATMLQYVHIDIIFVRIGFFVCCIMPMIERKIVN